MSKAYLRELIDELQRQIWDCAGAGRVVPMHWYTRLESLEAQLSEVS